MEVTSIEEFTSIARALQSECVRLRLLAPAFKGQTHLPGHDRTLRHTRANQVVVSVNRWRSPHAVTTDLIAGVLRANDLEGEEADLIRAQLWLAAGIAVDANA